MEEQERLTMEFVKSLMDKSYTLVWVDYNDNLDNCRDTWKSHATLTPLAKQDCPLWLQYD